jgi:ribosomal protein L37AE/L43A
MSDPARTGSPDGQRAVPYVCPFCAEEDLRPVDRGWHCRSCLRVFSVSFHGLAPIDHQHSSARPDPQESDRR